jgi:hypothetical protein
MHFGSLQVTISEETNQIAITITSTPATATNPGTVKSSSHPHSLLHYNPPIHSDECWSTTDGIVGHELPLDYILHVKHLLSLILMWNSTPEHRLTMFLSEMHPITKRYQLSFRVRNSKECLLFSWMKYKPLQWRSSNISGFHIHENLFSHRSKRVPECFVSGSRFAFVQSSHCGSVPPIIKLKYITKESIFFKTKGLIPSLQ